MMARIFSSNTSIDNMFSVCECLDSMSCVKEAITQDVYKNLYWFIHFVGYWEVELDEEWEKFFRDTNATHLSKFGIVEAGVNKRWQEVINFGRWMTVDVSQVAGWYKSMMICGPKPKPIRTGTMLHTLCITHGPLSTYKLFAQVHGGGKDDYINSKHKNTSNLQKWVTLYNLMLEPFKGKDRCVIMDST